MLGLALAPYEDRSKALSGCSPEDGEDGSSTLLIEHRLCRTAFADIFGKGLEPDIHPKSETPNPTKLKHFESRHGRQLQCLASRVACVEESRVRGFRSSPCRPVIQREAARQLALTVQTLIPGMLPASSRALLRPVLDHVAEYPTVARVWPMASWLLSSRL